MFRPYKWAIIRLLVEPMGRLYTRSWGGDEISSYIILWCSRLIILHMLYGYHVGGFPQGTRNTEPPSETTTYPTALPNILMSQHIPLAP